MTSLRKTVAKRLVAVKNETAMLTTFNEIDMSAIYDIRARYKDKFKEVYGTNVGFMSFFTKAVTEALYHFPAVNGMIDGEELVYNKRLPGRRLADRDQPGDRARAPRERRVDRHRRPRPRSLPPGPLPRPPRRPQLPLGDGEPLEPGQVRRSSAKVKCAAQRHNVYLYSA